jgi:hypothetical protein
MTPVWKPRTSKDAHPFQNIDNGFIIHQHPPISMTFKVNVLKKFPCFPGFRNVLKYIQPHGRIISEWRGTVGTEVIVAFFRLYPKIWLQELSLCFGHETQILPSLRRRVVEVTLYHGCMKVKPIFLSHGKNLCVYENRVRKKIPPETRYRVWRETHNTAFSNLHVNNISVIKLKRMKWVWLAKSYGTGREEGVDERQDSTVTHLQSGNMKERNNLEDLDVAIAIISKYFL